MALPAPLVTGATIGPRVLGDPTPAFSTRPRLGLAIWTAIALIGTSYASDLPGVAGPAEVLDAGIVVVVCRNSMRVRLAGP